jgi:hypothetical protein
MSKFRRLARVEETRNAYRFLVGKFFGKRSLVRSRNWDDNIEMGLR